MDEVRFHASEREEINITITTRIKPEIVEFDSILEQVRFLANGIAITQLQENKDHRDMTFISKETGIPAQKIEHLVAAHRLSEESDIDAAFFYALLRKNTLLRNDFIHSFHARLTIGVDTAITPLIYDAALTDSETMQRDIAAAVEEKIVPAEAVRAFKKNADALKRYKQQAENHYKNEHPRKVLELISRFVMEHKPDQMDRVFRQSNGDVDGFLQKLTDGFFFKSDTAAAQAGASLELGELFGFDEIIISRVMESQNIKKTDDLRKLAALNKTGWKKR